MKQWNIHFFAKRKIFFGIAIVALAVILGGVAMLGVNLDIQFKGGALITYSYEGNLDKAAFQAKAEEILGQTVSLQETTDIVTGNQSIVLSLASSEGVHAEMQEALATGLTETFAGNKLETAEISVVNPTIGREFLQKSLVAVAFASLLMVLYISIRFRKISGWSAGITAVIALLHDILMVFAVFVLFQIPINANFIAVCLTILGYSLNDTIVIYDRIRENKRTHGNSMSIEELVDHSLNQSFTRSLMTSVTTISAMVVVSVVAQLYHVSSILSFSFPMIVGMVSGSFSSLCIAPMLWTCWQKKKAA